VPEDAVITSDDDPDSQGDELFRLVVDSVGRLGGVDEPRELL
jgi:hypothetical protein